MISLLNKMKAYSSSFVVSRFIWSQVKSRVKFHDGYTPHHKTYGSAFLKMASDSA